MKNNLLLITAFLFLTYSSFAQSTDSINFISPVKSTEWKVGTLDTIKIYFKKITGNYNVSVSYKKVGNNYTNIINYIYGPGNSSIPWNIYNYIDSGAYNIILNDYNTGQYYYSDTFTINPADPKIQILSPFNNSQIQSGTGMLIRYMSVYNDSINVELSLNNGLSWDTLARKQVSSALDYKACKILIPNTSSKKGILKITNYRNTLSDSIIINLTTEPVYKFTSPTDTSKWKAGSCVNIQFSKSDSLYNYWTITCHKVDTFNDSIYFYSGSQVGLVNITQCLDAIIDSGKYYLEITDSYTGQSSYSDTFYIKPAQPVLYLQRISGNYLISGEIANLFWSSISINKIFVVLSKDGGTTWDTLATNLSSPNSYSNSAQIKLPIVDSTYANCDIKIGSLGKSVSSMLGPITLSNISPYKFISPGKNEKVTAGSTYTVQFNSATSNYCNVYYIRIDNGNIYYTYSFYGTNGLSSFSWQIDQYADSGNYRFAIYDQTFHRYFYGDTFYIAPAPSSLTITSPNSNYYLVSEGKFNLSWSAINSGLVNVVFSKDGGSTWDTLATNISSPNTPYNYNTTSILAPKVLATYKNCILKIVSKSGNVSSIISNIIISNKAPYQFIAPSDSTNWVAGNSVIVEFNNLNILNNYWQLSYQKIGGSSNYINGGYQTGLVRSYWNLNSYLDSGYYKLFIYDQTTNQNYYSDTFYIAPASPVLTITSPGTNYYLVSGETFILNWSALNSGLIHVDLSKDGGSTWDTLAINIKSPNTYYSSNSVALKVPKVSKTYKNCLLRIMNNALTAFNFVTNITISNVAPYQFISPNDTTKWVAGSTANVTFNNVTNDYWNLYYQKIGSFTFQNWIYWGSQTGPISYFWNIDSYLDPGYYQMFVYDETLSRSFYSDTFYIAPSPPLLNLTSPRTGTFYSGTTLNLYWASLNSGNINIEISMNGGVTWDTLAQNVYTYNSTSNWYQIILPVFDSITSNGLLKISNQSNNLYSVVSNLTFSNKLPHEFMLPTKQTTVSEGSAMQITLKNNIIEYNYIYLNYKKVGGYDDWGFGYIYDSDSVSSTIWYVPQNIDTGKYQIYFYDGTIGTYIYSDTFTITSKKDTIVIDYPLPWTTIYSGSNFQILYEYSGNVTIEISVDGLSWDTLATNVNDSTYFLVKAPSFAQIYNGGILRISSLSNTTYSTVTNLIFSNRIPVEFIYPTKQTIVNAGSVMNIEAVCLMNDWWFLFYKKVGGNIVLIDSTYKTSGDTIRRTWNIGNNIDTGNYQLCLSIGNQNFYSDTFQISTIASINQLIQIRSFIAYPNPFENKLELSFELPDNSKVEIGIYDLPGKLIKFVYSGILPTGNHLQLIDGSGLQSGVYIIQMKSVTGITRKQIVVKK